MKKRKNIARIEKEKCGKMGNLIENVFRLKVRNPVSSVFYTVKIKSIIRKELEKEIKRIDKMEWWG